MLLNKISKKLKFKYATVHNAVVGSSPTGKTRKRLCKNRSA